MLATENYDDGLYFFKKQLLFASLSIVVLIGTSMLSFHLIKKWGWVLWGLAAVLVLATFIPGLGVRVGGAIRWIQLPMGIRFEPGELLKISFSFLFATLMTRTDSMLKNWPWYLITLFLILPLMMLLKQPDFGSFAIILVVGVALLLGFGLRWKFVGMAMAVIIPAFYFLVMTVPYRRARVFAFLDPWADPAAKGFQVIQSMLSFHSGGLTGVGLGQGQGKLFFLPEAHTDFTLAVLGEELGFLGFVMVLLLYGFVVTRGIQIALKTDDVFKRSLALGLSVTFAISIFINAGVVMGLLPTKGLTLPFLSYGGSSLMVLSFMFGILLNIERSLTKDRFDIKFSQATLRK